MNEGSPLGVIAHMSIVAPVFDSAAIQSIVKDVETGNIPAMLSLIMHNQMCIDRKIEKLLAGSREQNHEGGGNVSGENKKARGGASKKASQ